MVLLLGFFVSYAAKPRNLTAFLLKTTQNCHIKENPKN